MQKVYYMQTAQTLNTIDALWTLIQSQSKAVRKALAKRLNETEKQESLSKRMHSYEARLTEEQRNAAHKLAETVKQALNDVKKARRAGYTLPDAHDLFKIMDEDDGQD